MSDYISRQAAIKEVHKFWNECIREQPCHVDEDGYEVYSGMKTINTILQFNKDISKRIDAIPAADVVEVVRCKDCKHRIYDKSRDFLYCEMYYGMGSVMDNNYCSYGERKDEQIH